MTSNPFQERRTRSQLKLSDDILKVPEQSPLKNARNASRKHPEASVDIYSVDYNEMESLPSDEQIKPSGSKRSVSPPVRDEYRAAVEGGRLERELKKMKWDSGHIESKNLVKAYQSNPIHGRTNSEPNAGLARSSPYKRVGNTPLSNKPHSTSDVHPAPVIAKPTEKGKARAQSVPLFPLSSSLPQLDLRNPPMSPRRARSRSRSPDKFHGLRVYHSPVKTPLLDQPESQNLDEPNLLMEIDHGPTSAPVDEGETSMKHTEELLHAIPEVCIQPPKSPTDLLPEITPLAQTPATPAPSGLYPSVSMSPLTPLPETPLPLRSDVNDNRYAVKDGWGFQPGEEPETRLSLPKIPKPDFGRSKDALNIQKVGRSQIPRPSIGPPVQLPVKLAADKGHVKQPSLKGVTPEGPSAPSSDTNNAFTVLMAAAKNKDPIKPQDKGKAKLVPTATTTTGFNDPKGREKGKAEQEMKKAPLKARMRGKEKRKPDAPSKFVPQVFDDDDEDVEVVSKRDLLNTKSLTSGSANPDALSMDGNRSEIPTPPVLEVSPMTDPESIHMPTLRAETEGESGPSLTQPSLPISSMASLSEPEPVHSVIHEDECLSAVPTMTDEPMPKGEEQATTVLGDNNLTESGLEVSEAQVPSAVDLLTEEKKLETSRQEPESIQRPSTQEDHSPQNPGSVPPKLVPKKRGHSNIPTSTRVTRSALRPPVPPPKQMRRPRANTINSLPARNATSSDGSKIEPGSHGLPSGSHLRASPPSPHKFHTPGSSPAKISLVKARSKPDFSAQGSPSPTKIARAITMFGRFQDDIGVKLNGSSLSTLSDALDKLKTPAPSRPNTSLGFNPDTAKDDDNDIMVIQQPADKAGLALNRDDQAVGSFSVGHDTGLSRTSSSLSSDRAGPSTGKPRLVQKTVASFFQRSDSSTLFKPKSSNNPRSAKNILLGNKPASMGSGVNGKGKGVIAGRGGGSNRFSSMGNKRLVQKASKKTTLPTVEASPVKAGGRGGLGKTGEEDSILDESLTMVDGEGMSTLSKEDTASGEMADIFMIPLARAGDEAQVDGTFNAEKPSEKGKQKDKLKSKDSSRRASMALSQLSQSLSAGPAYGTIAKGSMGPPRTPRKIARSASSSYPATSSVSSEVGTGPTLEANKSSPSRSSTSPDKAPGPSGARFSARQAAKAASNAETKSPSTSAGPSGSTKRATGEKDETTARKSESLSILRECRIFVDVRTDDGEEAGSLFIEMLESLGAKVQARVGQACTHVIFKNGVMSTITRYRLLRDPKPLVVGIAWVVECVEQRRRIEETPFLIDLSEMNIAGTNKRRRSMLPKLIGSFDGNFADSTATDVEVEDGDADVSMDGSTSSLTLDDDLTPLERARRRRSMIIKPSA